MKTLFTPASTCGRHPLKGATPAAWPSQFRGVRWPTSPLSMEVPPCWF
jgi:hypothetical protein